MPSTPVLINGTISNSDGAVTDTGKVIFTSIGNKTAIATSDGKYTTDISDIATKGDTVTWVAYDRSENQEDKGSFVAADVQTINPTVTCRVDQIMGKSNRTAHIVNIGGKPICQNNPLPIYQVTPLNRSLAFDKSTRSTTIMAYEHHEIHGGSHYYIEGYTTLGLAGTLYVKLVTPNSKKWAHFVWRLASNGILTTTLVEAPTGGMAGGAGVTPINNNRNSANTSAIVLTSGVTACTGGTIISQESFGSKSAGGTLSRGDELILKQNTTYCRTFLSGTANNIVSFKASWYEHQDKD